MSKQKTKNHKKIKLPNCQNLNAAGSGKCRHQINQDAPNSGLSFQSAVVF